MTTTRAHAPRLIAAALVSTLTAAAHAQDLTLKAPPQSHPIAIINAAIYPVAAEPIQNGYIIFDEGIITAMGESAALPRLDSTVRIIDLANTSTRVYPGLIASSTQIGLTEIGLVRATHDFNETGDFTPEVYAAVAVNPDSWLIPVTRTAGILTLAVMPSGGTVPGRASLMRADGWTWRSMAISEDAGLIINWPVMRTVSAWWMDRSEDDQRRDIQRTLDRINSAFDTAAAYHAAKAADPAAPTDVRWESMRSAMPGAQHQRPLFINAQDLDQITAAVTWAIERSLKPVIVGGRDAPLCADLLVKHNVPVIVGGTHAFPKRDDSPYDDAYTLPARLKAAGIRFAIASSDRTAHERNLAHNAATAVAFGLDHDSAVKSLTLWPAQILGIGDTHGSLAVGKSATLILTTGDVLEMTTTVRRAFIDGRDIDLSNKQTKLDDKYREKYRQKGLLPTPE